MDEALATAHAAQAREPGESLTKNLASYITKVKLGQVARPTKMPGM